MTALELAEAFLAARCRPVAVTDTVTLTAADVLAAVLYARYGPPLHDAPPWWAEVVYEMRGQRREDREDDDAA